MTDQGLDASAYISLTLILGLVFWRLMCRQQHREVRPDNTSTSITPVLFMDDAHGLAPAMAAEVATEIPQEQAQDIGHPVFDDNFVSQLPPSQLSADALPIRICRLAKNGDTPGHIAQQLQISRGEVELVLRIHAQNMDAHKQEII